MKNLFVILTLASVVVLGACKKGEEDPAIAFSSRDSRIAGTWNLTSGTITSISSTQNQVPGNSAKSVSTITNTYVITSAGADYTSSYVVNGDKQGEDYKVTFPFSIDLSVDKDGSYSNTFEGKVVGTNGNPKDVVDKASGIWNWINSGKNKVGIAFNSDIESLGSAFVGGDYNIRKLSGSEMILVKSSNSSTTESTSTAIITSDESIEMEFYFTKAK